MFTKENIYFIIEAFSYTNQLSDCLFEGDIQAMLAIKKYCDDNQIIPANYWLLEKLLS